MGLFGVCLLPNPITALEEVWVLRPHLQQLLCFPSEPWRRGPNESHSQKQVLSTTAAPPTETRLGASRSPDTHLFPEPCRCREEGTGRGNPALPSAPHPFAPHKILIAFAWNKCSDRSIPGYKNHRICSNLQCRCRGAARAELAQDTMETQEANACCNQHHDGLTTGCTTTPHPLPAPQGSHPVPLAACKCCGEPN